MATLVEMKENTINEIVREQEKLPEHKRIPVWFLRKCFNHPNLCVYLKALRGEIGKHALAQVA